MSSRLLRAGAFFILATSLARSAFAQDVADAEPIPNADESQSGLAAGHSAHGEAFNEGPRQRAYLMSGTGPIRFNVTTNSTEAADFVRQGMGQLHGYWTLEAERSFRQAAMLDLDCAIAYWGMAKANGSNEKRAKGFIAEAIKRKDQAGRLERLMIEALDSHLNRKEKNKAKKSKSYFEQVEKIAMEFPDELEAQAARAYLLYRDRSDLKASYEDAENALNAVLAVEPLHPSHHFRIHLWDYKDAAKALNSAAQCGQAAPDIAHMWHMPGHIYSRLKRYSDGAWQQEASARVDHAHMMRDRVMPDQIHNFAHNNEWLIRNLGHTGRWRDAVDLAMNMTELPQHPKYNTQTKRGSAYYGRLRLFEELFRFEQWELLAELCEQPYLEPTDDEKEQLKRLRFLGIAHSRLEHADGVADVLAQLDEKLKAAEKQKVKNDEADRKKDEAAEKKLRDETEKRRQQAEKDRRPEAPPAPEAKPKKTVSTDPRTVVRQAVSAVKGHQLFAAGNFENAIAELKKAAEDGLVLAQAQSLAGKHEDARKTLDAYLKTRDKRVQPLAGRIEILWRAGKKDEAKTAFEELRDLSAEIQFGTPVFDRLAPIAAELEFPVDWRVAKARPDDFGTRPELDELGPFRWQPTAATQWALSDTNGKTFSLADYKGRPVLVIFYLGHGCLHCTEQLKKFAPATAKFREAGLEVIAVSTDSPADLKQSVDNYEGGMPFPLVSNESLDVFKEWRVFDDFEQVPLHGTFLIDANGLVRWQDISHEPFMDPAFLIKESKRLLNQDGSSMRSILHPENGSPAVTLTP